MSIEPFFSIICITNDRTVLNNWTKQSLEDQAFQDYELIVVDNCDDEYESAAAALNAGAADAAGNYYIFAHHDLRLPGDFLENMKAELSRCDNLGLAGIAGVRETREGEAEGVNMIHHGKERAKWERGMEIESPTLVDTLDELMLVVPADVFAEYQFDPEVCPGWHLYGVEYSLRMHRSGLNVYALPLPLWHLSDGGWRYWRHDLTLLRVISRYSELDYIHTTASSWPATRRFALLRTGVSFARVSKQVLSRMVPLGK